MNKVYSQIAAELERGEATCVDIVQSYFDRIDRQRDLNVFITLCDRDNVVERARQIDRRLQEGRAGRLAGMVVAVKDAIAIKDVRHTAGSRILQQYVSPYDATVVERMEREDAIIIGKANMDEFAMGSSNENSAFGPVLNPVDESRVPGGSSGGSVVAVAAGMATTALGSETGGSVRLPASFCGVTGLKPTYGRISRYGLTAFASSFDQIGPIANNVADTALLTQCIAGFDELDSTAAPMAVPDFSIDRLRGAQGLRIGVPREYFGEGLDRTVRAAVMKTIDGLAREGAEIVDVSLPHTEYGIATYYILVTAEASSNLARYDGIRYTDRSPGTPTIGAVYTDSRSAGFGSEVKRRIMLGTYVLSAGYYDAFYRKAQKVRSLIKRDFVNLFASGLDCLVAPTSPTVAFQLGERISDPLTMYLSDVYTVNVNIAGIPSLTVPCGQDHRGLPIGIQVMADFFDESMCFRVGEAIERLS